MAAAPTTGGLLGAADDMGTFVLGEALIFVSSTRGLGITIGCCEIVRGPRMMGKCGCLGADNRIGSKFNWASSEVRISDDILLFLKMSLIRLTARGKGNRLARQVPRIEGERRARQTIIQLQTYRLSAALRGAFTEQDKQRYMGFVLNLDQARYMNMEVAAKVLLFMARYQLFTDDKKKRAESIKNNVNRKTLLDYVNQALVLLKVDAKKYSPEEYEIILLRTEAIFVRYIRYILLVKDDNNLRFNEMTIPEGLKIQRGEYGSEIQI